MYHLDFADIVIFSKIFAWDKISNDKCAGNTKGRVPGMDCI